MNGFELGDIIRNFGTTARVIGFRHDDGVNGAYLLVTGYGLLHGSVGRWEARPDLCELLERQPDWATRYAPVSPYAHPA